jgi:hypothetical protein
MKIAVTKKGTEIDAPARGFIEQKDIKLLIYTNTAKTIVKITVELDKKLHAFEGHHPYVLWCKAEQEIEWYLESKKPALKEGSTIKGVGKKRITKRK